MKGLREKDKLILQAIDDSMPQGIIPSLLSAHTGLSRQNLNRYLKKLALRSLVRKRKMGTQTYYFTINASPMQSHPIPFTPPTQRPHAIRGAGRLFRTSADRAAATLEALSIPYSKVLKGRGMAFRWRQISMTIFRNGRLELHPEMPEYPLNVPLEPIKQKAAHETAVIIEAFLNETGLRAARDPLGRLAIEITYWENGYPRNEIAENTTRKGEKKVYACDPETGKEWAWADNSLNPFIELETNRDAVDKEVKALMQSIAQEEVHPVEDEFRTRRELAEIRAIQLAQTNMVGRLENDLARYAHNEIVHLGMITKMDGMLNRINEKLNQRKLF